MKPGDLVPLYHVPVGSVVSDANFRHGAECLVASCSMCEMMLDLGVWKSPSSMVLEVPHQVYSVYDNVVLISDGNELVTIIKLPEGYQNPPV